jgi:hypothetical protein
MGAPKGNTNALRHSLYAKVYKPEDKAGLRRMATEDYRHEIHMLRVVIKNLFEIQAQLHEQVERLLLTNQPCDVEPLAKIANSLSLAVTSLNTTARTQALFSGTDKGLEDAFDQALNSLPIFLDERYLIETNEEVDGRGEILVEYG